MKSCLKAVRFVSYSTPATLFPMTGKKIPIVKLLCRGGDRTARSRRAPAHSKKRIGEHVLIVVLMAMLCPGLLRAAENGLQLTRDGRTEYSIVVSPAAAEPEQHAATELAYFLQQVTGAPFPITSAAHGGPAIFVGSGKHSTPGTDDDARHKWGSEGFLIRTKGQNLLLTGKGRRGTLYAVYSFLEDVVGCRWWSSSVSTIPKCPDLAIAPMDHQGEPAFEYREPFYFDAFDPDWAVRNKVNGDRARLDARRGGHMTYSGFSHTFGEIVPPAGYFDQHPEWFSEINGKRLRDRSQLCLTNRELRAFMAQQVIQRLREKPAAIASVSQNDGSNPCRCKECDAVVALEEAQSGLLLHFVNAVAEEVEKVFPDTAISTLAYRYTRKPPRFVRPRHNVIVRLCSIECDFSKTIAHGTTNAAFREDIRRWADVSERLYIWDYVTNFSHYIQPHPNLRVLGENVRFFARHNVKGLFEQGNYHSQGGEFAELRAWVLAKLMWDHSLDEKELISEFLRGYYGAAAPHIQGYIDLMHDAAAQSGHFLTYASPPTAPFLTLGVLNKATALFDVAEAAVTDQPDTLQRVKVCRLPIQYVRLTQWERLRTAARANGVPWPVEDDRSALLRSFLTVAEKNAVRFIKEGALMSSFVQKAADVPRRPSPPPLACVGLPKETWTDLQDGLFKLHRPGECAALKADARASDGVAAWMPGNHHEWATQCDTGQAGLGGLPGKPYGSYAVVRCDVAGKKGGAFSYGLYDAASRTILCRKFVSAEEIPDSDYHVYEIGTFPMHSTMYLWVAPAGNAQNVSAVWVDRFFLIRPPVK